MNDSNVSAQADTILTEAQAYIYARLRVREMLTNTTGSMAIGSDQIAVVADYIQAAHLTITGTNQKTLVRKTLQEVVDSYSYDGSGNRVQDTPTIYFADKTNINLDTLADQTYPYLLWYYQRPAALGSNNTTNFLTSSYPRLLRCACTAFACEWVKDSGQGNFDRTYWLSLTDNEIIATQAVNDREQREAQLGPVFL